VTSAAQIPFAVLDLATVAGDETSRDALTHTTIAAQRADDLGYHRFWVAEHHNMAAVASTSPPVLLAHIGAHTKRIHLGSGGVMLPNHAPLVIAEQFAILESLLPGRVDIGLGRAPGTDPGTAAALRRTANSGAADEFVRDIQDLYTFLWSSSPDNTKPGRISATPSMDTTPELWVLGSSLTSAMVAGAMGLPYSFANHFSGDNTDEAVALYRERFRPSEILAEPRIMVSINVISAATDAEAERNALPSVLQFLDLRRNLIRSMRTVEQAEAHNWSQTDLAFAAQRLESAAVGSPSTVKAKIEDLIKRTQADEIMVVVHAPTLDIRIDTLETVAKEFIHTT
jgi:luciferase family oxidoreductase group 1